MACLGLKPGTICGSFLRFNLRIVGTVSMASNPFRFWIVHEAYGALWGGCRYRSSRGRSQYVMGSRFFIVSRGNLVFWAHWFCKVRWFLRRLWVSGCLWYSCLSQCSRYLEVVDSSWCHDSSQGGDTLMSWFVMGIARSWCRNSSILVSHVQGESGWVILKLFHLCLNLQHVLKEGNK